MSTGLVGLKPNPTKGGYEYAAIFGEEAVHQFVEDDAAPGKLIHSQDKCVIDLFY
jgi:hypothetical protein